MKVKSQYYYVLYFFCISISLCAQDQIILDSLYEAYDNGSSQLIKIKASQEIVWEILHSDPAESKKIFEENFQSIKSSDFLLPKIVSYRQAAIFAGRDSDLDLAITYSDTARALLLKNNKKLSNYDYNYWLSSVDFGVGTYHYLKSNYTKSNECYMRALAPAEELNDKDRISRVYINIGLNYYMTSNYDAAIVKFNQALIIAQENNLARSNLLAHSFLGNSYKEIGSFEPAETNLKKAIELSIEQNDLANLQESYLALALLFEDQNQLDSSIYYINLSFSETEGLDYPHGKAQQYLNLARIQRKTGDRSNAKINFERFNVINSKLKNKALHEQYLRQSSELEFDLGNYKSAYSLLFDGSELHDSLNSLEQQNLVQSLEIKYESEKKEAQLIKKELQLQEQRASKNLFVASSVLLGLLATTLFFFFRNKLASSKLIADQDALLQSQKISQLEKEKRILAMNAMLEGQEAERMRIAKDLHDGLGGLLSTVKARLTNINTEVKKIQSYNIYEKTTSMVDEACDEVRRISHNLLPGALRLDGLKTAIEQLGDDLSRSHPFEVNIEMIGFDGKLYETKEIFIYRIIQEAANNIIKHANAKQVLIQLSETDNEYHLTIEDDGVGFDATTESRGLGLKSIRSRVEHLQGHLDISSIRDRGTTISIHIPKTKT